MCGIAGLMTVSPGTSSEPVRAMMRSLAHRGPDAEGQYQTPDGTLALGHCRLSILDLTDAGKQPMSTDDGNHVICYNGELYNHVSLRAELQGLGYSFRSRTDTEVVLKAFAAWGPACLDRLCGMFAFALWSKPEGKLYLVRDPLGMKPLYYTVLPGTQGFAFASEVKAFLKVPGFSPAVNAGARLQFLEFGYTFDPEETCFENVKKVPPGCVVIASNGNLSPPRSYYSVPSPVQTSRDADWEERLYSLMEHVVDEHLIADVPVGILLSGGLDSSIVAAFAARNRRITTITMSFADSQVDERQHARRVSTFLNADSHEVEIRPQQVADSIEQAVWYFDDLFADWGTFSTRLLYSKAKDLGLKVLLVGEGSDEVFGGYPIFQQAQAMKGPSILRLFRLYRSYSGRRFGRLFPEFRKIFLSYLSQTGGDYFHAVRLFELKNQLPNNYVMKVDKASMSVSTEARAPYLDRRIVDLACAMPTDVFLKAGVHKWILRSMADRYRLLPPEIIHRPKYGASIASSWMDDSPAFRDFAREVVLSKQGAVDQLGLRPAMTAYFDGKRKGYPFPHPLSIFSNLAWRLLLLNLWSRRYGVA